MPTISQLFDSLIFTHCVKIDRFRECALQSIKDILAKRICNLCLSSLYKEFNNYRLRIFRRIRSKKSKRYNTKDCLIYSSFVAHFIGKGFSSFLSGRPVLARKISIGIHHWTSFVLEFFQRLDSDYSDISNEFNGGEKLTQITNIEAGYSDPHDGGREILALTFNNEIKIAYKPRNINLDVAWKDFILYLHQNGAPIEPFPLRMIPRTNYGWLQWINESFAQNKNAELDFTHKVGVNLFLLYFFHGVDFHNDNIICNDDKICIVDIETLLHPHIPDNIFSHFQHLSQIKAKRKLSNSVLSTGLLPHALDFPWGGSISLGGLDTKESSHISLQRLVNVNSDCMRFASPVDTRIKSENRFLNSEYLDTYGYAEQVSGGFKSMYKYFLMHKDSIFKVNGPLYIFKRLDVRVVLRPTLIYSILLDQSFSLDDSTDGVKHCIHFDFLARLYNTHILDHSRLAWKIHQAEVKSLFEMDIPKFKARTDSKDLYLPDGNVLIDFFSDSSFHSLTLREYQLSIDDMSEQMQLIRQVFIVNSEEFIVEYSTMAMSNSKDKHIFINYKDDIDVAYHISNLILKNGIFGSGGVSWLGLISTPRGSNRIQVLDYDLYSGTSGIALFLSAFFSVTKDSAIKQLAQKAITPLIFDLNNSDLNKVFRIKGIGIGSGIGGLIYSLVKLSKWLEDDTLLDHIPSLLSTINPTKIKNIDLIGGCSGLILGLLSTINTKQKKILDAAILLGYHTIFLLNTYGIYDSLKRPFDTINLLSLAHGVSGVILALARLYKLSNFDVFLSVARSVWLSYSSYFTTFFNQKLNPMYGSWCNGISGIGCMLLELADILDDRRIDDCLEKINIFLSTCFLSAIDSFCCGCYGQIDYIFTAGLKLSDIHYVNAATAIAECSIKRANKLGGFNFAGGYERYNLSLFRGLSGIGYQHLRLHNPATIPSISTFE